MTPDSNCKLACHCHTPALLCPACCPLPCVAEVEKQKAAIHDAEEQLVAAAAAMTELRAQFDQTAAELRAQLALKTSEVEEAQQQCQQLQQQVAAALEGKQQAEQHCQEVQRNLERLTQVGASTCA